MIYAAARLIHNGKILVSKKKDSAKWTIPHQLVLDEEPIVTVLSSILYELDIPAIFKVDSISQIYYDTVSLASKYTNSKLNNMSMFMCIHLFDITYYGVDRDLLNYYLYSEPTKIKFLDYNYFIDHLTTSPINHILVKYMVDKGYTSFGGLV